MVAGLEEFNIIQAACGRNHTLFLTDTGCVYACGDNKSGQCGVGNTQPIISKATRLNYSGPPIIKVGCGADFSMILDIKGNLYSFGLPEYGQLGHNTDGKYFLTSTKMSFHFETSPKQIVLYVEKTKEGHVTPMEDIRIVDFACGNNHSVSLIFFLFFVFFFIIYLDCRLPLILKIELSAGVLVVLDALDMPNKRMKWSQGELYDLKYKHQKYKISREIFKQHVNTIITFNFKP